MNDGPFTSEFDIDLEGVIRREIITYRYNKNGTMQKEIASRSYFGDDYNDSTQTIPMQRWES
jgi:hypothetical protein|tara:strand:- start:664 stop:849 length:186 start_codon:yes stop_codon:yes gene_type:complete